MVSHHRRVQPHRPVTAPSSAVNRSAAEPHVARSSSIAFTQPPLLQEALAENRQLQQDKEDLQRHNLVLQERIRGQDASEAKLRELLHQATERKLHAALEVACQARTGNGKLGNDEGLLQECASHIVRIRSLEGAGQDRTELGTLEAEAGLLRRASEAKAHEVQEQRKRKRGSALKADEATEKLRHNLKATLAKVPRREGADAQVGLPKALQSFMPLAKDRDVQAAAKLLHELELAVARQPRNGAAIERLRVQHRKLAQLLEVKIAERTGEGQLAELIPLCEAAITAGNRDFLLVYDGVFKVIANGEAAAVAAYGAAARDLRAKCKGEAKQRDEASDAATLFADGALTKPSFDEVVRCVCQASGATLELAVLGEAKGGEEVTGLKKTYRCIEKAQLRPEGDGRGSTNRVCDVVRAMLIAKDMATIVRIADAFSQLSDAGVVTVVRTKDRFTTSSEGGWRDLMINFVIEVEDGVRHVCEVQVVHEMMLTARKGLPGHEIYAIVRVAMELIESCRQQKALKKQMVKSMREANATRGEILQAACEDAWVLEDAAWLEAGSREAVLKAVTGEDLDEEGRITRVDFAENKELRCLPLLRALGGVRGVSFGGCSSLTSIELPAGLTTIAGGAFSGCSSLTSIELPAGLTTIGGSAFSGCSSLTSIELPAGLTTIGGGAFDGCSSLTSIELPAGLTTIGGSAFSGCSSLTSIELPAGLTTIGDGAFSGCSSLTSIELPAGLTTIGDGAFYGCSSLTSIELLAGLTTIEGYAFSGCSSLTSIELPAGLTTIGGGAFSGCSSLTSIELPAGLTTIEGYAFSDCSSLTSIELPAGLTTIGGYAFGGCSSLMEAARDAIRALNPDAF